jgi:hypothetical protein
MCRSWLTRGSFPDPSPDDRPFSTCMSLPIRLQKEKGGGGGRCSRQARFVTAWAWPVILGEEGPNDPFFLRVRQNCDSLWKCSWNLAVWKLMRFSALAVLTRLTCPCYPIPAVLSRLSCSNCPPLTAPVCSGCPALCLSWLSCPLYWCLGQPTVLFQVCCPVVVRRIVWAAM